MAKVTDILSKIVDLLEPLDGQDRQRIVQAAFVLLGEGVLNDGERIPDIATNMTDESESNIFPKQAQRWLKQNNISNADLNEMFQIDGQDVEVIGDIPGAAQKEQTISAYILAGAVTLLSNGSTEFDDDLAREMCKECGCYSISNHSAYLKTKGNLISGSKEKGWKLTAPGMKRAAELIKKV